MTGITLAIAEAKLEEYLAAEAAVLLGQRVVLSGQDMTRADLKAIQQGVEIWNGRVAQLSRSGRMAVREVIPR